MKLPKFRSRAFLAPMAGITNAAFRLLCAEQGAGLVVTELTSVHSILAKEKEVKQFVEYSEEERPVSVQLFGNDIKIIQRAAKIVEPYFDIIDFNMGCPAPHITQQMAGAALLQKKEHVEKIFSKIINAVEKPVTLKMRAGISGKDCYRFKEIAKIAEDAGISMIALHPRTVKQGYSGKADWNLIKELKNIVNIPVIGNGDIDSPEAASRMIEETGCDYVMVGRAARGNPFIFRQIDDYVKKGSYKQVNINERIKSFRTYLEYSKKFKVKISDIKVHAMSYTKGIEGSAELRRKLAVSKTIKEIEAIIEKISV